MGREPAVREANNVVGGMGKVITTGGRGVFVRVTPG